MVLENLISYSVIRLSLNTYQTSCTKFKLEMDLAIPGYLICLQMTVPYAWSPSIVDLQIFRIGQLAIISVPAEFR